MNCTAIANFSRCLVPVGERLEAEPTAVGGEANLTPNAAQRLPQTYCRYISQSTRRHREKNN